MQDYVASLRTPTGYKRVTLSPLRYAGGKSKAVGHILAMLPDLPSKRIVSPFFGGGSVELVLSSHLGYEVIGYDIFPILVNFWQQVLTRPGELADELAKLVPDKDSFTRNRHILLSYWNKVKPADLVYTTRNPLELTEEESTRLDTNPLLQAAYYYYNMQLSYGPMFLGWPSSVYLKPDRYASIVERIRTFKAGKLSVSCASFEDVIQKHPDDFLFLDPPYYLDGDSTMFKGLYPNCNFAIHHTGFPHERLRDLLKVHRGGFLLTYNDCSTIREWYSDCRQEFPKWQYTYGQGETRIGKHRPDEDTTKESRELFLFKAPA